MEKPAGTVKAKKRYLIGHNLAITRPPGMAEDRDHCQVPRATWSFGFPKASNRFHFTGGARFVHGGAMLQEIVVPVITVKQPAAAVLEKTRTRQVSVQVLGSTHKITTHAASLPAGPDGTGQRSSEAAKLKVAMYEGDEPVTSIESVTFDSTSGESRRATKGVILTLQDRHYDKRTRIV